MKYRDQEMASELFTLKNIYCQYKNTTHPVLNIEQLLILSNEIVFIVGASGVGKSTILETLGLMNNTVSISDNNEFTFNDGNAKIDLLKIWECSENTLANFRKKFLSFIFQNTNLFSNLSAYNNILITPLLQGESLESAKQKVDRITSSILAGVELNRSISTLSGGQRQRVAFARAVATQARVLFADEPTGNLDIANANKLMSELIYAVKESNKTAIIVSHDINLIIKYATKIILINKIENVLNNNIYSCGSITPESSFIKQSNTWTNNLGITYTPTEMWDFLNKNMYQQAGEYAK